MRTSEHETKTYEEQNTELTEVLSRWPESKTFGLRGWRGENFRVSHRASYHNGQTVMLYTQIRTTNNKEGWEDFCKGTETELKMEITPPPFPPSER